ncbi:DNA-damage-inducible SOS response protein [compost metagenome]
MLLALLPGLALGWWLQPLGNHGLWLAFLGFMLLRSLSLAVYAYRLTRADRWFAAMPARCAG